MRTEIVRAQFLILTGPDSGNAVTIQRDHPIEPVYKLLEISFST
jgi:hypothetical protein